MLKKLRLVNFRSFRDFTLSFGDGAYLVGPNNAGKSTILTALRLVDALTRLAHRRNPQGTSVVGGIRVMTHPINLREFPALRDSLRYEFGDAETRIELEWRDGAKLVAIWPEDPEGDEAEPYFYLLDKLGMPVRTIKQAKESFPILGIIPILGPVEHSEKLLADDYVRLNVNSRLSSRHFRNQMRLMKDESKLDAFWSWAAPWLDETTFDRLALNYGDDGSVVSAYFYESTSRVPKEIVWAGDGIQVWLQILYHVYRCRTSSTLILDEPEVYLHPDLQRRLVRLLESLGSQTIVATHSAEMVAEADGRLATLIDKTRRRAVRPRQEIDYEMLSNTLGTAFNLRLAKALRSKVAVFVEGQDMSILRVLARTLGLKRLAGEAGVTVMALNGYSGHKQVAPFKYLLEKVLPDAIATFVILDRDYRPDSARDEMMEDFKEAQINCHVWVRKELESYLITPEVIARLSGASVADVTLWLGEITDEMESEVFGRLLDEQHRDRVNAGSHAVSVTTAFKKQFDVDWAEPDFRLICCPAKQVVSALNRQLQSKGHKAVSTVALARAHRADEIPVEMRSVLVAIEDAI